MCGVFGLWWWGWDGYLGGSNGGLSRVVVEVEVGGDVGVDRIWGMYVFVFVISCIQASCYTHVVWSYGFLSCIWYHFLCIPVLLFYSYTCRGWDCDRGIKWRVKSCVCLGFLLFTSFDRWIDE